MTPWKKDITIKRGDTKEIFFRVRERVWSEITSTYVPGAYRDLTGWTVLSQIRTSPDAASPSAEFNVTMSDQVETPGGVLLRLTPAQTASMTMVDEAGKAALTQGWDIQLTDPAGDTWTFVEGVVTITKDYSRV